MRLDPADDSYCLSGRRWDDSPVGFHVPCSSSAPLRTTLPGAPLGFTAAFHRIVLHSSSPPPAAAAAAAAFEPHRQVSDSRLARQGSVVNAPCDTDRIVLVLHAVMDENQRRPAARLARRSERGSMDDRSARARGGLEYTVVCRCNNTEVAVVLTGYQSVIRVRRDGSGGEPRWRRNWLPLQCRLYCVRLQVWFKITLFRQHDPASTNVCSYLRLYIYSD